MFANTAKYQVVSVRQAAPAAVALAHSNDNTVIVRAAGAPPRTRRANLACRWRATIGGGLECHWDIESADGLATEEPDQRWIAINGRFRPTLSLGARRERARHKAARHTGRRMNSET
jgi:hypothetical protein